MTLREIEREGGTDTHTQTFNNGDISFGQLAIFVND